jgi:urease accessory protein
VHNGALRDAWRIWRGDALIYADALTWHAAIAAMLQSPAIAPGMIAFATLLWVHPNAIAGRDRLRACAGNFACSAVSSWNGILAIRLAAPDGARLRRDIIAALHSLEPERPLPSLWRS